MTKKKKIDVFDKVEKSNKDFILSVRLDEHDIHMMKELIDSNYLHSNEYSKVIRACILFTHKNLL